MFRSFNLYSFTTQLMSVKTKKLLLLQVIYTEITNCRSGVEDEDLFLLVIVNLMHVQGHATKVVAWEIRSFIILYRKTQRFWTLHSPIVT